MTVFISGSFQLLMTAVVTWWLCRKFINPDSKLHLLDHPNERSLHEAPVPRSGGVAILAGMAIGLILFSYPYTPPIWWLISGTILIAAVSMADDWLGLSAAVRFVIHLVAAAIIVYGIDVPLFSILPTWFNVLLLIMATVWLVNLYNFMDGMDGFAGGMGVIGFLAFAVAGWMQHAGDYFSLALLVAAANAAFLFFNFPPARIFMGDAGSASMGFLVAGFSLWGMQRDLFDFWFPLLVFSPFILDATVTLLRRALRGEKVWQAHRKHYYQRLALAGWGHKKTVLVEYVLMLAVGASAMAMLYWEEAVVAGLIFWAVVYGSLAYKADRFCRH